MTICKSHMRETDTAQLIRCQPLFYIHHSQLNFTSANTQNNKRLGNETDALEELQAEKLEKMFPNVTSATRVHPEVKHEGPSCPQEG